MNFTSHEIYEMKHRLLFENEKRKLLQNTVYIQDAKKNKWKKKQKRNKSEDKSIIKSNNYVARFINFGATINSIYYTPTHILYIHDMGHNNRGSHKIIKDIPTQYTYTIYYSIQPNQMTTIVPIYFFLLNLVRSFPFIHLAGNTLVIVAYLWFAHYSLHSTKNVRIQNTQHTAHTHI